MLLGYWHRSDPPHLSDFHHEHEGLLRIRPEELLPQLANRLDTRHQVHGWGAVFDWRSTSLQGLELWGETNAVLLMNTADKTKRKNKTKQKKPPTVPGLPARPSPPSPGWCWIPCSASRAEPLWSLPESVSAQEFPWNHSKPKEILSCTDWIDYEWPLYHLFQIGCVVTDLFCKKALSFWIFWRLW